MQQKKISQFWHIGIIVITAVHLLQTIFTELHPDEAYYWMYAQFLDWGYFDHPPMVALYIKLGTFFGHGEFFLRLATLISGTIGLIFLWKLVNKITPNASAFNFFILYLNFALFQVYGFITTPDTALLLGTILFFYVIEDYIHTDNLTNIIFLSLVILFLLYSKYHAVLLLFFTLCAFPKFLTRKSFYAIIGICILGYLPHLWWQFKNDFPSLHYHLFDRNNQTPYQFWFTTDYILAQILFGGALLSFWVFQTLFKIQLRNPLEKILFWNAVGILSFFFLASLNSKVEAHWSLIAFIPLFILSFKYISEKGYFDRNYFKILAFTGIVLVSLVRLVLIFEIPFLNNNPAVQLFHHNKSWANELFKKSNGNFCLIDNGFQKASYYNFYNQTISASSYNSKYYRKTQYDFWHIQNKFRGQKPIYFSEQKIEKLFQDSLSTSKGKWYLDTLSGQEIYDQIAIKIINPPQKLSLDSTITFEVVIHNPYPDVVSFNDSNTLEINLTDGNGNWKSFPIALQNTSLLKANSNQKNYSSFTLPSSIKKGAYTGFLSIQNNGLAGTRNSDFYKFKLQ